LEIAKWADVIEAAGVQCYYITGESDRPANRTVMIDQAHFAHPTVQSISQRAFDREMRDAELTNDIMTVARSIRDQLTIALREHEIDAIIAENALTIPMNLPLGIALVQAIQEEGIPCIAHHHDFYWERDRFIVNAVDDVIRYAFPPALPQIQHVVINSIAAEEFSRRTGLSCRIIPNVMDFAHPPEPPDEYAAGFRRAIGMQEDELLILQPTRVVERKGIEHSIELVRRLDMPKARLVITHASGDEGDAYENRIREYAHLMNVNVLFADQWIADRRGTDPDGKPLFTIQDVYPQADLVAYPSEYEGFGNAFLEAIYHRCPVLCNRYLIYRTDIEPCGFQTILFDGFLTHDTIAEVKRVLRDDESRRAMVERNYKVATEYFSYQTLEDELRLIVLHPHNIYRILRRRKS
jgi:glycosyltransferase involved in cell wall biosynthesis